MNRKKALVPAIVLIIALFGSCNTTRQQYNDESDFTIKILDDEKTVEITGYIGLSKDVIIPPQIRGLPVTKIKDDAFRKKGLNSVVIPNGVTHIGIVSFAENRLTRITIPDSVTKIGSGAFVNNNITEIIIPNNVTSIEGYVFRNNKLTSITIPEGIVSIGDSAFENNKLTEITIPKSVTSIGRSAFSRDRINRPHDNNITKITIGDNVKLSFDAFPKFDSFYDRAIMKKGGTYIYSDHHWSPEGKTIPVLEFASYMAGEFSNIAFLADMPDLETVSLDRNDLLTDISPLSGLTKLRNLCINKCPNIRSIESLSLLTNLKTLDLEHNINYDYRALVPLRQLEKLIIYNDLKEDTEIDLSYIGQLHSLKELDFIVIILSSNIKIDMSYPSIKIMNINALQNLVNLEKLIITGGGNLDISWISNLRNLTELDLECTINDISPLATLSNLVKVDLTYSTIKDITPLLNSNSIKYIRVWADDVEAGISDDLRSRFYQKNIDLDTFRDTR